MFDIGIDRNFDNLYKFYYNMIVEAVAVVESMYYPIVDYFYATLVKIVLIF